MCALLEMDLFPYAKETHIRGRFAFANRLCVRLRDMTPRSRVTHPTYYRHAPYSTFKERTRLLRSRTTSQGQISRLFAMR